MKILIVLSKEIQKFMLTSCDVELKSCDCESCRKNTKVSPKNIYTFYLNNQKYVSRPHNGDDIFEFENCNYWVRNKKYGRRKATI